MGGGGGGRGVGGGTSDRSRGALIVGGGPRGPLPGARIMPFGRPI